jgi:hypothetical protein
MAWTAGEVRGAVATVSGMICRGDASSASSAGSASAGRESGVCSELGRVGTDVQDSTRKCQARAASRKGVGSCQAHGHCFCRGAAYVVQVVGTQETGLASVVHPDGAGQTV